MPILFFFKIDLDTDFCFWSGITEVGFALYLIQLKYMKQYVLDIEQWQNRTVIPERRETKKWTLWLPQFTVWEEFPKPRRNRNSVLPPKLWRHSSEFRETDMARIFRTEYQTGGNWRDREYWNSVEGLTILRYVLISACLWVNYFRPG